MYRQNSHQRARANKACASTCRVLACNLPHVLAFTSLLLATTVHAEPLSTDRPGVADPPSTVAPGTIQLEGGVRFERETDSHGPHTSTLTVPEGLLRVGMFPFLEFRLAADGFLYEGRSGVEDRSSGSDLEIGARARFSDQHGVLPAAGFTFMLNVPTGSHAVTSDGLDPSGTFLLEWSWGGRYTLDANLELAGPTLGSEDSRRAFWIAPAISLATALGARTSFFIEYYSQFVTLGEADKHAFDGGFTWLLSDDLQIDISAGAGLNDAASDFFVSAGVAWRFSPP